MPGAANESRTEPVYHTSGGVGELVGVVSRQKGKSSRCAAVLTVLPKAQS